MGYGYDNDMSYRLAQSGYRLIFCPGARAVHGWRDSLKGYLVQQYGLGYGRIDLVAKHPGRIAGDRVSPFTMMLHPLMMSVAVLAFAAATLLSLAGQPARALLIVSAVIVGALFCERVCAAGKAARRFGDRAVCLFPVIHLLRDLAWVAAMATWLLRRLVRRPAHFSHSMRPRPSASIAFRAKHTDTTPLDVPCRAIAIIPAHNEVANLPSVVSNIKRHHPSLDVLVVDDGSSDGTADVLKDLPVMSMHFPERLGIGSAMRAGLRYAARLGCAAAVRLDGDGQHDAADIATLLAPILSGSADVAVGTRYSNVSRNSHATARSLRLFRVPLAWCLTALTDRRVTDPTSGFCAFGSTAIRMLAEHHPDGYAEPELRLFLSRNGLRTIEVPVRTQQRLSGWTSLTPLRLAGAAARVALAVLIVPLRAAVRE
jgi:GT2 family glycosyltransferase